MRLRPWAARFRLRTLLATIAAAAVALAVATPPIKRALGTPNTWIVRTVTRPDGTLVRQRIRRLPDRDRVFEEVLPAPSTGPVPKGPR